MSDSLICGGQPDWRCEDQIRDTGCPAEVLFGSVHDAKGECHLTFNAL